MEPNNNTPSSTAQSEVLRHTRRPRKATDAGLRAGGNDEDDPTYRDERANDSANCAARTFYLRDLTPAKPRGAKETAGGDHLGFHQIALAQQERLRRHQQAHHSYADQRVASRIGFRYEEQKIEAGGQADSHANQPPANLIADHFARDERATAGRSPRAAVVAPGAVVLVDRHAEAVVVVDHIFAHLDTPFVTRLRHHPTKTAVVHRLDTLHQATHLAPAHLHPPGAAHDA